MIAKSIVLLATAFGLSANASTLECLIVSELGGERQKDKFITEDMQNGDCLKDFNHAIPGSSVEIQIGAKGACAVSNNPGITPFSSILSIEIHDRATGNYTHSFGSYDPVESTRLQLISNGQQKVNTVVSCALKR